MTAKTQVSQTRYFMRFTSLIAAASLSSLAPAIAQTIPFQSPETSPETSSETSPETSLLMAQAASLSGSWKLVNMTAGSSPMPMLPTVEQTVEFADGKIAGTGGCNRMMGSYQIAGEQLKIGPLASTFMACEPDVMTQESRFLTALQGAQRYAIEQPGQLAIFYETEEGAGVLRFAAQANSSPVNQPAPEPAPEPTNPPVRGLW